MVRRCSSMPIYPYMLLDYMLQLAGSGKDSSDGRITIGKHSRSEQKHIVIKDVALIKEVHDAMTLRYCNDDFKVGIYGEKTNDMRLRIYRKQTLSNSVTVRPPPLPTGSMIQNIAMTSYLDLEDENWVLAIKLYGSKIKLYRRSCKPTWIDVKCMPRSIYTSSSLMYSKKDERFYVPTPGGDFLYSLDPKSTEDDHPQFIALWTEDLTRHLSECQLEANTFNKTVHFVEAPSGEQFLVKWFFYDEYEIYKGLKQVTSRTVEFMVLRAEDHPLQNKKKQLFYTDNIGDLCIFLGHGEPFCVRASSHPGLRANCIYFAGYNFGVYDLTTNCCNLFFGEEDILSSTKFPYWPQP